MMSRIDENLGLGNRVGRYSLERTLPEAEMFLIITTPIFCVLLVLNHTKIMLTQGVSFLEEGLSAGGGDSIYDIV